MRLIPIRQPQVVRRISVEPKYAITAIGDDDGRRRPKVVKIETVAIMEMDKLILKKLSVWFYMKRNRPRPSPRAGGRTAILCKRNHWNNLNNSNARVNVFRVLGACRPFCGHVYRTVPPQTDPGNGLVRVFLTSTVFRVSTDEPARASR